MRTSLPFACALALSSATPAFAQIPNGGFENWYSNVNYMEPSNWWTTNMVTYQVAGAASCLQGTPGAVGNYHMEVTSMTAGSIVEGGRATCGNEFTGYPGFAYAARPVTFEGQVQYAPQGGDVGRVHVALWGWNSQMTAREVIGVATYNVTGPIATWQPFSVPFTYLSASMPDTARVFIEASGNNPVDGTTIRVDDLGFGTLQSVQEQGGVEGFTIQASALTEELRVNATERIEDVIIQDLSGRALLREVVGGTSGAVSLVQLPAGMYMVSVRTMDGRSATLRIVKDWH